MTKNGTRWFNSISNFTQKGKEFPVPANSLTTKAYFQNFIQDEDKRTFNKAGQLLQKTESSLEGLALMEGLAQKGIGKAAYNTAVAYLRGIGHDEEGTKSVHFMLMAAEAGVARAFYPAGVMLYHATDANTQGVDGLLPQHMRRYLAAAWHWRAGLVDDKRVFKANSQILFGSILFKCIGCVRWH